MNNSIQSLWIGGQLSNVERLCIQSFIDHGHEFYLYAYDEIKNAPIGTVIIDAGTIIGREEIFTFKSGGWGEGSVSGFADLFRLLMVQKNGGWWVDMDVICLKPFDFTAEMVFCSSHEGEYGELANNSVFKSPKNSRFIARCLEELTMIDLKNMFFGQAGPFLFQRVLKELQLEDHITPYTYFNPINWKYIGELILGQMSTKNSIKEVLRPLLKPKTMPGRKLTKDTYAVHFWNEAWKANKLDKNGRYPVHSLFEKLKRKHNIV